MFSHRVAGLISLLLLVSCSGGGRQGAQHLPELLSTVPSNALAVVCHDNCKDGLAILDSADILRSIDYGRLKNADMALSWHYEGSLTPILAIATGRNAADSSSAAGRVMAQAERLGLCTELFDAGADSPAFLAITPSESQLAAVRRHVSEGRSVLDAPDFTEAAALAQGSPDFLVLRGSGMARLVPKGFLDGMFEHRRLTDFLRTVSQWIVITADVPGGYSIRTAQGESSTYYANALEALPFSESRLDRVLPQGTEFAISLPVSNPEFRHAYERYLDACVRFASYGKRLARLEAASGKDPLEWEKGSDIREVAIIRWKGQPLVLVRQARALPDNGPEPNPLKGFIPALYGQAFSLKDDGFRACRHGWMVMGGEAAVREFISEEHAPIEIKWPGKGCRLIIYEPGKLLGWNKQGIRLWNSVQ